MKINDFWLKISVNRLGGIGWGSGDVSIYTRNPFCYGNFSKRQYKY